MAMEGSKLAEAKEMKLNTKDYTLVQVNSINTNVI